MWSEAEYRREVQGLFDKIEKAFADVDPDVAECENSMGALTITRSDGSRLILSMQPSVRQIWLALAAQGTAYHFNFVNFDSTRPQWLDDKGREVELVAFLKNYFRESAGIELAIGG